MEEIILNELTLKDRIKLKRNILKVKKNMQNQSVLLLNNQKIQNLQIKVRKVKEKKEKCILDIQKRVIKEKEYENRMHQYDLEEYEYKLEILLLEKKNFLSNSLINRLNCLSLLLSFLDGVEVMVIKDSEGKKKKLYIQDIYQILAKFIINDAKSFLELEQKIAQMYMLMNTNPFMTKENTYFLEEEKQKEVYALILEYRDKMEEIHSKQEIDWERLCINDFFNEDILDVYERCFNRNLERKITKNDE